MAKEDIADISKKDAEWARLVKEAEKATKTEDEQLGSSCKEDWATGLARLAKEKGKCNAEQLARLAKENGKCNAEQPPNFFSGLVKLTTKRIEDLDKELHEIKRQRRALERVRRGPTPPDCPPPEHLLKHVKDELS